MDQSTDNALAWR